MESLITFLPRWCSYSTSKQNIVCIIYDGFVDFLHLACPLDLFRNVTQRDSEVHTYHLPKQTLMFWVFEFCFFTSIDKKIFFCGFTHYYQQQKNASQVGLRVDLFTFYEQTVVKSVYYGNTVVTCFPFLSPGSWLVSALRTTTEMRIKRSSSAWFLRSCTISRTAQTASPVKRPRWGRQNTFTVSHALFPCAQTEIVTYAQIVRKYSTLKMVTWHNSTQIVD